MWESEGRGSFEGQPGIQSETLSQETKQRNDNLETAKQSSNKQNFIMRVGNIL